ncbi:MAG: hypothetical protein O2967_16440 [Proteobacteria bacterium]|nr:hypothetical protein [Pseudomonadota bacterium]
METVLVIPSGNIKDWWHKTAVKQIDSKVRSDGYALINARGKIRVDVICNHLPGTEP